MKIVNRPVNYNADVVNLSIYDINDINKLENGSYFGMITPIDIMDIIYPKLDSKSDGNLNYSFAISQNKDIPKIDNELKKMAIDFSSFEHFKCHDLPLIFQKIDENFVKELISGELFATTFRENYPFQLTDTPMNMQTFQKELAKYSNNNVVIYCPGVELADEDGELSHSGILEVNDVFKYLYGRDTLPRRKEIATTLRKIKMQAQTYFNKELEKCIDISQNIANTDNFLYDTLEKTNPKKRTKTKK